MHFLGAVNMTLTTVLHKGLLRPYRSVVYADLFITCMEKEPKLNIPPGGMNPTPTEKTEFAW